MHPICTLSITNFWLYFQFSVTEAPLLPLGSVLGWSYEFLFGPISYDVRSFYPLYFLPLEEGERQMVGETYRFNQQPYGAVHSIAVDVIPGEALKHSHTCIQILMFDVITTSCGVFLVPGVCQFTQNRN